MNKSTGHIMMPATKMITACLVLLFGFSHIYAQKLIGKVVGVMDGDTIEVLSNRQTYRIRLEGIDCPEKNQAYGAVAKQVTSGLCFGKNVKVTITDKDRYGRFVGKVILPSGNELNATLLKNGYAWHYKQYNSDSYYATLEASARKAGLGLWAQKNPIPPWQFRKAGVSKQTPAATTGAYVVSRNSTVFHKPSCQQAKKIKASNRIWLQSKADAIKQGYKPCKRCRP